MKKILIFLILLTLSSCNEDWEDASSSSDLCDQCYNTSYYNSHTYSCNRCVESSIQAESGIIGELVSLENTKGEEFNGMDKY